MKRITATQQAELLDELYAASVGEVDWAMPLRRVSQLTGSADAMFQAWDMRSGIPDVLFNHAHLADAALLDHYGEHIASNDPRAAHGMSNPVQHGQVLYDAMFVSEREMRRQIYYDFLSDCGDLRYYRAIRRELEPGLQVTFSLQRTRKEGPGTNEHDALLRLLDPHSNRLAKLMRLDTREEPLLKHLLKRAVQVVFIVGADQRLHETNQSGASALERGNDFIQFQNRLCMTDPVNDALLVGLINRANSAERHNPRGGSIKTARFDIDLFPLKLNWWDAERSYAVVATKRPLLDTLTAAEQRLASGLMQGQTLREYAQTSHISYETARTHLKRVMLKTATHSQAQLVSFLLSTDC